MLDPNILENRRKILLNLFARWATQHNPAQQSTMELYGVQSLKPIYVECERTCTRDLWTYIAERDGRVIRIRAYAGSSFG